MKTMSKDNPFYYNLPTQPADFVGRWPLVEEIVADLSKARADSWAVIGGRRFGKSSVLKAIESHSIGELAGCDQGDRHTFPLIVDLKGSETDTEQNVYARIVRLLHRALRRNRVLAVDLSRTDLDKVQSSEKLSFYQFEDTLDNLTDYFERHCGPLRLALLLDEVEATTRFPWSETLFNQLRALIYDGPLSDSVKLVLTGSARVVQVRHAGSPLLNAVKIIHLESFPETALRQLIARGGEIPAETSVTVQIQSGGHPFIAQYLLHHLWEDGLVSATSAQVEQITRYMRQRRAADLRGWWKAIGDGGQRAYRLLTTANDWVDESELLAQIHDTSQPLDQGLAALCYHGLAVRDESGQRYRAVGALFQDWFNAYIAESLEREVQPDSVTPPLTFIHIGGDVGSGSAIGPGAKVEAEQIAGGDIERGEHSAPPDT
jgi:hypothetical protein